MNVPHQRTVPRPPGAGVRRSLALLATLWAITVGLVAPSGEFPLNDDWAYALAVQTFLERGTIELTTNTTMMLLPQIIWGALFCLPFGFSFTALRVSTLVLGLVGVLASYGLFREAGAPDRTALLCAAALATNPLYLALSFTFMTDVPFTATALLGTYLLLRWLLRGRSVDLALGVFLVVLATLIRQVGVFVGLAFAAATLARRPASLRTVAAAAAPFLVSVAALRLYVLALAYTTGVPALFEHLPRMLADNLGHGPAFVEIVGRNLADALLYLGLFAAPMLVLVAPSRRFPGEGSSIVVFGACAAALAVGFVGLGTTLPSLGNVLYDCGLGPVTVTDVYLARLRPPPFWAPPWVWVCATAVGAVGLCALAWVVAGWLVARPRVRRLRRPRRRAALLAFGLVFLAGVLLAHAATGVFDRYLLLPIPVTMVVAIAAGRRQLLRASRARYATALVLVAILGTFSITATHDYLSWNRARWHAVALAHQFGAERPEDIDGGYEYLGWSLYRANPTRFADNSWWLRHVRVSDPRFIVTFGPVPGFYEVGRVPYPRWLPPGSGEVFLLRR